MSSISSFPQARNWPVTATASPMVSASIGPSALSTLLRGLPLRRRCVKRKEIVFRCGQPRHALYLVHAGTFKTSVLSQDGREKITGFRMSGDLLGLDALDMSRYACDATALDVGELWELPPDDIRHGLPALQDAIMAALAGEIRRDGHWMLAVCSLTAEQRVIAFLADFGARLGALGFSAQRMTLRMSRADMGNFLGMKLETVVRALSRLQSLRLIEIQGHEIRILAPDRFVALLDGNLADAHVDEARRAA